MDDAPVMVVGQIARDLVLRVDEAPEAGEAVDAHERREVLGGKGANQAVALAQLGVPVGLVAVTGDDGVAGELLNQARRDGIDVTHVTRREGTPTGLIVEVLDAAGRWRYVQDLPEAVLVTEGDVTASAGALRAAPAVLLQLQEPAPALLAAARYAKDGGALVVCDGEPPQDARDDLLALTDVFRADDQETELLTGIAPDDVDHLVPAARDLLEAGPRMVVFGLADGNLFVWPQHHLLIPKADVPVADTTGGGDTLTAALTAALLDGQPPDRAARIAAAASTSTVTRVGGRPGLDHETLRHYVEHVERALRRS